MPFCPYTARTRLPESDEGCELSLSCGCSDYVPALDAVFPGDVVPCPVIDALSGRCHGKVSVDEVRPLDRPDRVAVMN